MDVRQATKLIHAAVGDTGGVWADIGAGTGTFTRALVALLGTDTRIYAVDRDARALSELSEWADESELKITPVRADFTKPFELPALNGAKLDGLLIANALHFVKDADEVLARLVGLLRLGGRVVFVEYDRRDASQWVPFPIPRERLAEIAAAAGLSAPTITATRPSRYQGTLYVAAADRAA